MHGILVSLHLGALHACRIINLDMRTTPLPHKLGDPLWCPCKPPGGAFASQPPRPCANRGAGGGPRAEERESREREGRGKEDDLERRMCWSLSRSNGLRTASLFRLGFMWTMMTGTVVIPSSLKSPGHRLVVGPRKKDWIQPLAISTPLL